MDELVADEKQAVDRPPADPREVMFARGTQPIDSRIVRGNMADIEVGVRESDLVQIVHDLKAPLAVIALEITLLLHRLAEGEDVEARPILARVMHNIDFLDRMVHDLLDGWLPEPQRGARARTDLRGVLDTTIAHAVPPRDRMRVRLEARHAAVVSIDELRIQRVIGNLLSNALKYAPAPCEIVVRLDVYEQRCCVSVIDSGPGVTQAEADFIFDKYRRTASARVHQGSGLGLYVSRQIVEDHGGVIGVESVPGTGSRFFFELALA